MGDYNKCCRNVEHMIHGCRGVEETCHISEPGYVPPSGVWTAEERDAWKHGILERLDGLAIFDVRSGEPSRIVETHATLIRALEAEHGKVNSSPQVLHYSFECDVCALLAALKGEK